ncbi:AMP-binding protein [Aquiluna sp.]|nr:AMP-binding protein [Aquiluna sp.]
MTQQEFWQGQESDNRVFVHEDGVGNLTFDEIFSEAEELGGFLSGTPLALVAVNTWSFVAAYIALLRKRTPFLLLDPSLEPDYTDRVCRTFGIKEIWSPVLGATPGSGAKALVDMMSWDSNEARSSSSVYEELAMLMPTSGSTGSPKSVRVSRQNLIASTASISRYLEMTPERVLISSLPFHYTYGLSLLNLSLYSRSKMVITRSGVLSKEFWDLFSRLAVTDFSGVPFHFESLQRQGFPREALGSLQCVTQAGGKLAPAITQKFLNYAESWGFQFFTMYGQTEATPRISYVPPSQSRQKLGSVGVPIDIGKITVRNEQGSEAAAFEVGEVFYEGPNVCLGYASSESDLEKGDLLNGLLGTGDLGYLDEDGYLFLTGRAGREIKVSGHRVNLDEISNHMGEIGLAVAVSGATNRIVIEVLGSAKDVRSALKSFSRIHPTRVEIYEVDELTRLPSGKLDIAALNLRWNIG